MRLILPRCPLCAEKYNVKMPGGLRPPLEQFIAWPRPNYDDPITKPKYVLVFSCILGPISLALLVARLWVRLRIQKSAGWDDWLMFASWFPMMALTVIFPLVTERFMFNRHLWDIPFDIYPMQRYYVLAIYVLFSIATGLIKMSILLFYRRLSSRAVSETYRWTLRILIAIIAIHTIIFVCVTILMCNPVSAFWKQEDFLLVASGKYEFKCMNEGAEIVSNGVISTLQDFFAASLPAVLCWNLQMNLRKKIALYCVFAVSYVVVAFGALRTYSSYRLFFQTYDVTWTACDIWLWSLLEVHVGAMCANAPTFRVFYLHYFGSGPSSSNGTTSSSFKSKISFWKKGSSPSSRGYILESHSSKHGNIVQTSASFGGEKPEDVEMGRIHAATHMSVVSTNVQALPPVAPAPWKNWARKN
ncbi:hypothetical protein HBH64_059660 [Parastagonospora nodorum]|nr:hypothetical protein HBH49_046690 [Parastagonospora nodorum]KAH4096186.1 hypothetical protein HBH48_053410 [Parastagonospora nodorum]KAH4669185.1 hypothetical protein HBH80_094680 [Parastagonospora nodorum]KAH4732317.1 hypothetical protein HBH66_033710 [Parastagonospora nodorum]KAH4752689.1 hypothetical protein HBH64_059660 [Parastagonospora nodorum]